MPPGTAGQATTVDVVVVGAGFAGMYMLHRLRGLDLTVAPRRGDGSARAVTPPSA